VSIARPPEPSRPARRSVAGRSHSHPGSPGRERPPVPASRLWRYLLVLVALIGLPTAPLRAQEPKGDLSPQQRQEIERFCADCHAMPGPQAFPKAAWMDEVRRGFKFYANSGRSDLAVPRVLDVARFFRDAAPDKIPLPDGAVTPFPSQPRFQRQVFPPLEPGAQPSISFLKRLDLTPGTPPWLVACDMKSGTVLKWNGLQAEVPWATVGQLGHPSHAEVCDLDADGALDLVVADLGTFTPSDKLAGRVVWMRRTGPLTFETRELQTGIGRVADVEPGDFDGDGDLDLIVAEFGWQKAGRILLLRNSGSRSEPRFELEEVDPRHGTIHVPPTDWNGDGHLDFVALISQEHEVVETFLNDGTGKFRSERVFSADEPSWGSSGIQLVDLDRDGDLDVLCTNGDTFDSFHLKPFHSVFWLENEGKFPFRKRHLTNLPGVHRAIAADLDNDGDLDVAACALLPGRLTRRQQGLSFDAVIWLEQTAPGEFTRQALKHGGADHAALEAVDLDDDGLLDLVVGSFAEQPGNGPVEIFWNRPPAKR
jgi:hypothetical protein